MTDAETIALEGDKAVVYIWKGDVPHWQMCRPLVGLFYTVLSYWRGRVITGVHPCACLPEHAHPVLEWPTRGKR